MAWPSPQGSALTDDEEKLLWDPDELDAKHWITSENGLDLNTFKLRVIRVLIKQARFKWHGQPPEDLGDSSDSVSGCNKTDRECSG
jgi:hypothetical protein